MQYQTRVCLSVPVEVQHAQFAGARDLDEHHLVLRPLAYADIATQLQWLHLAYEEIQATVGLGPGTAVLRRLFCSDLANQSAALAESAVGRRDGLDDPCAVSWVGMAPPPPARVTLWAYHLRDRSGTACKRREGETLVWQRGELEHHWMTGVQAGGVTAGDQVRAALAEIAGRLHERGMSWRDNVLRTWLFVRDIDTHYADVVTARRDFFAEHGLTPQTHFVASTGIDARAADPTALLTLDAYAIRSVRPEQITYLRAPEYLGPTHLYGVTFERGVAIEYRDRRHILISGTASIDPAGQVVYAGDVDRQVARTLTIIAALLKSAGAEVGDLSALTAYVRDPADLPLVAGRMRATCGPVPTAVVVAPICRPAWLVEIEAAAVVAIDRPELPSL